MVTENKQSVTNTFQNRKIGLDVLRVYAIFSVVYGHGWYIAQHIAAQKLYFLIKFDNVTMFFVLTGFLISLNLLKLLNTNQISTSALQDFWVKRLVRTYPLYLFMLLSFGFFYFQSTNMFPVGYINYFGYIQNFNSPHPNFYPELWSLAVQEWFYFLFPIVLYSVGLLNIKNKKLLAVCFIFLCIFFITIFRLSKINSFNYADTMYWDLNLRKQVVTRLDSLLYGFMMAYMLLYHADFF